MGIAMYFPNGNGNENQKLVPTDLGAVLLSCGQLATLQSEYYIVLSRALHCIFS